MPGDIEPDEELNQVTPRQFAVLLILSQLRKVNKEIADNQTGIDPTDLFRSQIMVWLQRTREELLRAVRYLHDHDGSEDT